MGFTCLRAWISDLGGVGKLPGRRTLVGISFAACLNARVYSLMCILYFLRALICRHRCRNSGRLSFFLSFSFFSISLFTLFL